MTLIVGTELLKLFKRAYLRGIAVIFSFLKEYFNGMRDVMRLFGLEMRCFFKGKSKNPQFE